MIAKDSGNVGNQKNFVNEEEKHSSDENKYSNKKMLTMEPRLIKEMQEYADKWTAGSFTSFVAMIFQMFKNNLETDKK